MRLSTGLLPPPPKPPPEAVAAKGGGEIPVDCVHLRQLRDGSDGDQGEKSCEEGLGQRGVA